MTKKKGNKVMEEREIRLSSSPLVISRKELLLEKDFSLLSIRCSKKKSIIFA